MKVVADATPLIVLAKIGSLDLLPELYPRVHIPAEVYAEAVVAGAGLPGAFEVATAKWIEVKPLAASGRSAGGTGAFWSRPGRTQHDFWLKRSARRWCSSTGPGEDN